MRRLPHRPHPARRLQGFPRLPVPRRSSGIRPRSPFRWAGALAATVATAAILACCAAARPALADELISIHGHADAVKIGNRSQPPRDTTSTVWLAADRMRRDEGGMTVLVRLDRNMLYLINHADRTYSQVEVPIDWHKMIPPADLDSFNKYLADNEIQVAVKPSAETRQVKAWNARRVDVALSNKHGLKMDTQMWLTTDLPLYAAYNKMSGILAAMQPNAAAWSEKVAQLAGMPVYQVTTITIGQSVSQTREEVASVDNKTAPPGTYDVPQGFKAVPFNPFPGPQ
jgi:hypothetical protein